MPRATVPSEPCPCTTNWQSGEYHHSDCEEAKKLRDAWCTPTLLTSRLPTVDLDPASNERSTVKAIRSLWLERGENGLEVDWDGSVFLNGPYSDMLPWALKARAEWSAGHLDEAIFLVKLDPTTEWWKVMTKTVPKDGLHIWLFNKRLQHDPPPRIKASTNNFASALIHWRPFIGTRDTPYYGNTDGLPLDEIACCYAAIR